MNFHGWFCAESVLNMPCGSDWIKFNSERGHMIPCCIIQIKVHMNYKSLTEFCLKSSLQTPYLMAFCIDVEVTPNWNKEIWNGSDPQPWGPGHPSLLRPIWMRSTSRLMCSCWALIIIGRKMLQSITELRAFLSLKVRGGHCVTERQRIKRRAAVMAAKYCMLT